MCYLKHLKNKPDPSQSEKSEKSTEGKVKCYTDIFTDFDCFEDLENPNIFPAKKQCFTPNLEYQRLSLLVAQLKRN